MANDNKDQMKMVSIILICIGAGIFIVGFFGCCGAIRESKCMLGVVSKARAGMEYHNLGLGQVDLNSKVT